MSKLGSQIVHLNNSNLTKLLIHVLASQGLGALVLPLSFFMSASAIGEQKVGPLFHQAISIIQSSASVIGENIRSVPSNDVEKIRNVLNSLFEAQKTLIESGQAASQESLQDLKETKGSFFTLLNHFSQKYSRMPSVSLGIKTELQADWSSMAFAPASNMSSARPSQD